MIVCVMYKIPDYEEVVDESRVLDHAHLYLEPRHDIFFFFGLWAVGILDAIAFLHAVIRELYQILLLFVAFGNFKCREMKYVKLYLGIASVSDFQCDIQCAREVLEDSFHLFARLHVELMCAVAHAVRVAHYRLSLKAKEDFVGDCMFLPQVMDIVRGDQR